MAKLKEVCTFYSGTGFPTKYQGNDEGEYAFYKVGDIANNVQLGNTYLSVCNNYISGEVAKEIKICRFLLSRFFYHLIITPSGGCPLASIT